MVKFFGLILTTLCIAFEVNGISMNLKSTNPFTNNYVNYEHSSDSILETDIENVSTSHFENPNFNQSQPRMNTSNPNLILKQKRLIPGNQNNNTQSANEANLQMRNLSSDTGRTIIEPTSSLAKPQNIDISPSVIQGNNNIRQLELGHGKLSEADVEDFRKQVLDKSNNYRNKYNFPEFKLNTDINRIAQNWADTLAQLVILQHSNSPYGENLYMTSAFSEKLGENAVDSWYDEIQHIHKGDTEEDLTLKFTNIGHFTQLLWKTSEKIGVGVGDGGSNGYYVVVNYDPPGNTIGKFLENIPKLEDIILSSSGQRVKHYVMGGIIIFLRLII